MMQKDRSVGLFVLTTGCFCGIIKENERIDDLEYKNQAYTYYDNNRKKTANNQKQADYSFYITKFFVQILAPLCKKRL